MRSPQVERGFEVYHRHCMHSKELYHRQILSLRVEIDDGRFATREVCLSADGIGEVDGMMICVCSSEGGEAVEVEGLVEEFVEVSQTTAEGVENGSDEDGVGVSRDALETEESEVGRREEIAIDERAPGLLLHYY